MIRNTLRRHHFTLRILPILVLAAMLSATFSGCGSSPDSAVAERRGDGKPAPDFSLSDLQGTVHRLSDYKGKVVVINFWDTWCGPCRKEIPGFIALQKQYGPEGLQLLGVALGKEGTDRVRDHASMVGINYPVLLLGNNSEILTDYGGISSIPATFVVDRQGNIADQHIGYLSQNAFQALIAPVLGAGS